MNNGLRVYAQYDVMQEGFEMWVVEQVPGDESRIAISESVTMHIQDRNESTPPPAFILSRAAAALLMDSFWEQGIRPANYLDIRGEVSAQAQHIKDLRNIINNLFILTGVYVAKGDSDGGG